MRHPLARLATRAAYGSRQLSRVAWYIGHSVAIGWLSKEARRRDGESTRPRPQTDLAVPDRKRLYADMANLFRLDLANVEAARAHRRADKLEVLLSETLAAAMRAKAVD